MPNPRIAAARQNVEQVRATTRAWFATKPARRLDWSPVDFQEFEKHRQAQAAATNELNQALAEATILESVDEVQQTGDAYVVYWSETVERTTTRPFRAFAALEEAEEFRSWMIDRVGLPAMVVRREIDERAKAQNGGM